MRLTFQNSEFLLKSFLTEICQVMYLNYIPCNEVAKLKISLSWFEISSQEFKLFLILIIEVFER